MAQARRVPREQAFPQARQRHRDHRHRRARDDLSDAGTERPHLAVAGEAAFREQADQLARLERHGDLVVGAVQGVGVLARRRDRDGAHGAEEEAQHRDAEDAAVHHPADRPPAGGGDHQRVDVGDVIAHQDRGAFIRDALDP